MTADTLKRTDKVLISHIIYECEKIVRLTESIDYDTYLHSTTYQDALIRPLEIIGEAAGNLSEEFEKKHSEIPVHDLRSLRNVLVHQYFRVDIEYIWIAAMTEIPAVLTNLLSITDE